MRDGACSTAWQQLATVKTDRLRSPTVCFRRQELPAPHVACCEDWVHLALERRRFSRTESDSSCRHELKCFDQPHARPGWVLEAVDQDCPPLTEAAARQFSAVGYSTAIIRLRRQDLLRRRVLVATVVAPEACHLDFNSPVGQLPQGKIALISANRVVSLPRVGVDATTNGPQLCKGQRYSLRLPERTNPRLIEPFGGTAARPAGVSYQRLPCQQRSRERSAEAPWHTGYGWQSRPECETNPQWFSRPRKIGRGRGI